MFIHTYIYVLFVCFLCVIFVLSDPFDTECLGFVWFTAQFPHTTFGYMQLIFYSRPRQWWRHQPESNTHTHASQQTTHDQRSAKHCLCQICYQQWMNEFVKNLMYFKFQSSGFYVDVSIINEAQLLPVMSLCLLIALFLFRPMF